MGDHLCTGPTAELSPPLEANEEFESQSTKPSYRKHERTPPPEETSAMGQAYMHRGQLTPVSQSSGSRDASPAYIGRRESSRRAQESFGFRKATDVNWETPDSTIPVTRTRGYGGFEKANTEKVDKPLGGGLMDRMKTSVPGPFDPMRQLSIKSAYPQRNDSLVPEDPVPPKPPPKDGYEGFGAPKNFDSNGRAMISRSETYPMISPSTNQFKIERAASGRLRSGGSYGYEYKNSIGPDTSRKPPPRISLLPEHSLRNTGSVDLAAEFGIGNPYHTPSDSASSGHSDSSRASGTTAQSSPARSHADYGWENNAAFSSTSKPRPNDLYIDLSAEASPTFSPRMGESPPGISPKSLQFDERLRHGRRGEEGYDFSSPRDGDYKRPGPKNNYRRVESPSPQRQNAWERRAAPESLAFPRRGDCRACGVAIKGKSISSADGRLTGKYHKACFVCTTCTEPFSSSVFYVLGDKPYCEQHYHKLNGSLCGHCGRGIEGQYVEDETRVKYHMAALIVSETRGDVYNQHFHQRQIHINAVHPVVLLVLESHMVFPRAQDLDSKMEEDGLSHRPTAFRMEYAPVPGRTSSE
ncbi:hypothetical protein ED733_008751 [Metarhizium rileyi]|uniref:LIM zinc-binding domain-containing protein n=1 Tax=Metarhizium rileyi (strain RCEF 4871) TaxID=1649241 RepID=A0A5C6GQ08_METRR|nr:hypothetical protein ED733_008751 [Metarhizium rileyi]